MRAQPQATPLSKMVAAVARATQQQRRQQERQHQRFCKLTSGLAGDLAYWPWPGISRLCCVWIGGGGDISAEKQKNMLPRVLAFLPHSVRVSIELSAEHEDSDQPVGQQRSSCAWSWFWEWADEWGGVEKDLQSSLGSRMRLSTGRQGEVGPDALWVLGSCPVGLGKVVRTGPRSSPSGALTHKNCGAEKLDGADGQSPGRAKLELKPVVFSGA